MASSSTKNKHKKNKSKPKDQTDHRVHQQYKAIPTIASTWNGSDFDYEVDYNDHFETPVEAYKEIFPVMRHVMTMRNNTSSSPKEWTVYDPYYCNGRTSRLLTQELGIGHVVHEKRDFYVDILNDTLPANYDIFMTNPPYSDDHKQKCIQFCINNVWLENRRPFFLLMPCYVASRHYYRKMISTAESVSTSGGTAVLIEDDIMYVIPSVPYKYDHPEGTGYDVSPFDSLWFCCIGRENIASFKHELLSSSSTNRIRIATSIQELATIGIIKLDNRPNPKQRRKKNKNRQQQQTTTPSNSRSSIGSLSPSAATTADDTNHQSKKRNSKYRDEKGARKKKRF